MLTYTMNQLFIHGTITKVKRVGGLVDHIVVHVNATQGSPAADIKIVVKPEYNPASQPLFKKDKEVGITGHIETVVRGRYGTVTTLVCDLITFMDGGQQ